MERITSRKNPLCVHIKKLGASRGYRTVSGEFLCDGLKLLDEAVNNGAVVKTVLTCSELPFPLPLETRVCFTSRDIIDSLSPLKNSQDTLFVCRMPDSGENRTSDTVECQKPDGNKCKMLDTDVSRTPDGGSSFGTADSNDNINIGSAILLDSLQDPGNVGTIIRTADALGILEIMLYGSYADLYNPKTIRATMGAIFRQKVTSVSLDELKALIGSGVRMLGASVGENCRDIAQIDLNGSIIAIGSEGNGLSEPILSLCDELITIPISTGCDSLNAATAASIIMWELVRCRL